MGGERPPTAPSAKVATPTAGWMRRRGAWGDLVYHVTNRAPARRAVGPPRRAAAGRTRHVALTRSPAPPSRVARTLRVRASWASPGMFYYVSDGKIRRRNIKPTSSLTIEFSATMQVTRASRRLHALASATSRPSFPVRSLASFGRSFRPTVSRSPSPVSATSRHADRR